MAKQDTQGWGFAPAAEFWYCPECAMRSAVAEWPVTPDGVERSCPHCGFVYHAGFVSSGRISQANAAGHVVREQTSADGITSEQVPYNALPNGDKCKVCHPEGAPF